MIKEIERTQGFKAGLVPSPPATGKVLKICFPQRLFEDLSGVVEVALHLFLNDDSSIDLHNHKDASEAELYSVMIEGNSRNMENQGVAGRDTQYQSHSVSFNSDDQTSAEKHKHVTLDSLKDIVLGLKVNQENGSDLQGMLDQYGEEGLVEYLNLTSEEVSDNRIRISIKGENVDLMYDEEKGCYTGMILPEYEIFISFDNILETGEIETEFQH